MRKLFLCVFALFWSVICTQTIHAHELRPAYLSVTETHEGQYEILWKTPALGEKQLALKANFPEHCTATNGVRRIQQSQFAIETWTLNCPQPLRGQALTIGGLEKTLTDVLVRTAWLGGDTFTDRLTPNRPTLKFANTQTRGDIAHNIFCAWRATHSRRYRPFALCARRNVVDNSRQKTILCHYRLHYWP